MKICQFITCSEKLQQIQNHYVLSSIKWVGLLYLLMIKLNMYYYLVMGCLIKFGTRLNSYK